MGLHWAAWDKQETKKFINFGNDLFDTKFTLSDATLYCQHIKNEQFYIAVWYALVVNFDVYSTLHNTYGIEDNPAWLQPLGIYWCLVHDAYISICVDDVIWQTVGETECDGVCVCLMSVSVCTRAIFYMNF